MKIIDLESHFYTHGYIKYLRQRKTFPYEVGGDSSIKLYHNKKLFSPRGLKLEESLLDLGKGRIEFMDKNGIDM